MQTLEDCCGSPYCQAEFALREAGTASLLVALDYLDLLADVKPETLEPRQSVGTGLAVASKAGMVVV